MNEIDLFLARLPKEEGQRMDPYDDATGLTVHAPKGKLTWGRGYNLAECGSSGLFNVMDRFLVSQAANELLKLPWYAALDPVRRSVCLDIDYNAGERGLLHFPSMIHYLTLKDFVNAAAQCRVEDTTLNNSRYASLRKLLLEGSQPWTEATAAPTETGTATATGSLFRGISPASSKPSP